MNDLHEKIASHFWWHSIDLGNGVVTDGWKTPKIMNEEISAFFDPLDLTGKSILDIGAWNGGFSVAAKRRGAGRVVAADSFVWHSPRFNARKTIELVLEATKLDIELIDFDVMCPPTLEPFDIVLMAGVFYHLKDPIQGLANAANLSKEIMIVETHLDLLDVFRPAMAFYPGSELSNDPTNWWGPNPACIEELLKGHGFAETSCTVKGNRGTFHAWR